jgi:hypothetical protein
MIPYLSRGFFDNELRTSALKQTVQLDDQVIACSRRFSAQILWVRLFLVELNFNDLKAIQLFMVNFLVRYKSKRVINPICSKNRYSMTVLFVTISYKLLHT